MPPSAIATWPERLGSIRQVGNSAGFDVTDDVAADVGALVERARRQLLHFAAELVAEQAAERAGEVAALVGDLTGDAERAVQRGRDVQPGRGAVHHERPARDAPADFGLAEQFGERIFVLAGHAARGVGSIASRMASAATATGATITEVRVTGCKGLSAAVAGRLSSSGLPGKKRLSAHSVLEKNTTMTTPPEHEGADRQAEEPGAPWLRLVAAEF